MLINQLKNRIIVIKPKKNFLAWIQNTALKSGAENLIGAKLLTLEELQVTAKAYILPLLETPSEMAIFFQNNYDLILENEFMSWCADKQYWPKERGSEAIKKYFFLEPHGVVIDLYTPTHQITTDKAA